MVVEVLHDARELNVMVALGTHPGYSDEGLNHLVGIASEERATTFYVAKAGEMLYKVRAARVVAQ